MVFSRCRVQGAACSVLEGTLHGARCTVAPQLHLCRLTYHAHERPPLAAALRTRLDDGDGVAGFRLVLLVVHHELRRQPRGLAVQTVTHLAFDRDDDALLHLVADDGAEFFSLLRHYAFLFCRSTVFTRARSRRSAAFIAPPPARSASRTWSGSESSPPPASSPRARPLGDALHLEQNLA